jgi:hypothetical protein
VRTRNEAHWQETMKSLSKLKRDVSQRNFCMGKRSGHTDTTRSHGPLGVFFLPVRSFLYSPVLPEQDNDLQELWPVHGTHLQTLNTLRPRIRYSNLSDGTKDCGIYLIIIGQINSLLSWLHQNVRSGEPTGCKSWLRTSVDSAIAIGVGENVTRRRN